MIIQFMSTLFLTMTWFTRLQVLFGQGNIVTYEGSSRPIKIKVGPHTDLWLVHLN